jgi:predicted phage baseplate assembly protein
MPLQSLSLKHAPVIAGSVKILVDGKKWTEVHDFDGSGPGDTHFTVDCESATVRFGDGEHGAIPPFPREEKKKEKNIVVKTYRSGGGIRGNIPVHYKIKRYALHRFFDPKYEPVKIAGFTRPVGGAEAETVDAALDRGRRERKSATRLIGEGDIGELARQTPGTRIHSLRVLFDYHPLFASIAMPGAITVAVVPFTRDVEMVPPVGPSRGFLARIKRFLDDKRIIASDLRVVGPVYVPVSVDALLRIRPHFDAEAIKAAAEKAVGDFINPFSGGPDRKGWEFGRSVFAAEITALLQRIEGVACVETPEVKEWKEDAPGAADKSRSESVALPKTGLPYAWFSRGPDIPARSSITIRIAGE